MKSGWIIPENPFPRCPGGVRSSTAQDSDGLPGCQGTRLPPIQLPDHQDLSHRTAPSQPAPACAIAKVILPQEHKLEFVLLAVHEVPANMYCSSSFCFFLEQRGLGDLFRKDAAKEGIESLSPVGICYSSIPLPIQQQPCISVFQPWSLPQ